MPYGFPTGTPRAQIFGSLRRSARGAARAANPMNPWEKDPVYPGLVAQERGRLRAASPISPLYDQTAGADQPWYHFLPPEQAARARTMATAQARPGPTRQAAFGDPFGLSAGTGLGPKGPAPLAVEERMTGGVAGRPMGMGTMAIRGGNIPGQRPMVTEAPAERAGWGQVGLEGMSEGEGYVRLSDYPTRAEQLMRSPQALKREADWTQGTENRRRMNMGLAPVSSPVEALGAERAGLGAQTAGANLMRSRAEALGPMQPRMAEAETAGMEAESRLGGAQADTATAWAGAIQQMGPQGLIASMNQSDPMESATLLSQMAAQAREAGDEMAADWFQRAAIAKSGGQVVDVPDPFILNRIANVLNRFFGLPEVTVQQVIPAAPQGRAAAMGGTAGAQPQMGEQDERELYERLKAKYGA